MAVLAGAGIYIVRNVLSDNSPKRKDSVTMIALVKPPPPPPQIKEKPPEPEQVKQEQKQEVVAQIPQDVMQDSKPAGEPDNAPAGDNLGVDAEGTAGGDAFGLVGRKGGRSILAGGGGSGGMGRLSMMTKFAGYARGVESAIQKRVMKRLDDEGWFPRGKLQTIVRISLDVRGAVTKYEIVGSSGDNKMDSTVVQTLKDIKFSPPPENKATTMSIRIVAQS